MPVYRYQLNFSSVVDAEKLSRLLPDTVSLITQQEPAIFLDVTVAATSKVDLDDMMLQLGFSFVETDPTDDPIDAAGNSVPPHAFGGDRHTADTLSSINILISDATLIDTGDSRLSDARTPTGHKSTHETGGSDSIKLDDLASPDDNTDLNASTSKHGLLPKLAGGTADYLRADGTWSTPSGGSVDEDKIIYVGKHGSDTNDGKNIGKAVLTFGKAITLASAQFPSPSNVWGITCKDAGIYSENISLPSCIHLFSANATLQGSISLSDDSSVEFEKVTSTLGTAITKSSGSGTCYIQTKKLEIDSCIGLSNSSSGYLNTEIEFYKQTGGTGLQNTGGGITHADIQDWDLYGVSPVAVKTTNGMTNVRAANIADRGGSGTSVAFDCDGGITNALVVYSAVDTCYAVETGATLNLITANCTGTEANNGGTVNITKAGQAGVQGPQGPQGIQGIQGPQGAAGTNGVDGDFIDGGEAGGANRSLGNTDNYALALKTNNVDRITIDADGDVHIGKDLELTGLRFNAEYDNGNSSTADTVDWSNGQKQKSTLTGNCTYTFTAPSAGVGNFLLKIIQDGTGNRTVTWPATVKWAGGTAPTLSTGAGDIDIVSFYWDGTTYFGVASLDFA